MVHSLTVNDIGHGPLTHVFSFLNPPELDAVCTANKSMHDIAILHSWKALECHYYLMQNSLSCGKTAAHRCHRFYEAQQFSMRMQEAAIEHFDYNKSDCRSPSYKPGYDIKTILPTLNVRVFRMNQSYEFFVRFDVHSHDENTRLVWQGFLPCQKTGFNELSLDMSAAQQRKDLSALLHLQESSTLSNLAPGFEHLTITVTAMETFPDGKPSLVLATGGLRKQQSPEQSDNPVFTMCPRNARPYAISNDEDWINVELRTSKQQKRIALQRIVLSHHW